ncbi:MAG: hypothetical protein JKY74_07150 [Shewanella sp.]|nr:hypothetical protein [Shewanella sp.]
MSGTFFLPTLHQTTFDKSRPFTLLDPRSGHMGAKRSVLWMRSIQLFCSEKRRSR